MRQLTPSNIYQLTPTILNNEKHDSVYFSIHTVRLKLGIIFPREMPTLPPWEGGGLITSVSATISMGENQIFSGTSLNNHFSEEILLAGNHI